MEKRLLEYEDLRKVEYLSAPDLAPDGKTALYVVSVASEDGDFIPHVYEITLETKATRRISDTFAQDRPAFSPDGTRIAYISREASGDELQIHIYNKKNGEDKKLTAMRHGVSEFRWSPDGKSIAFTAKCWVNEEDGRQFTEMTADEKKDWLFEREHMPVAVENLMYKFDEAFGLTDQSVQHIYIVGTDTGRVTAVTQSPVSYYRPTWSHDGKRLVFYGKPYTHTKENRPALFLYDIDSGLLTQTESTEYLLDLSPALFTGDGEGVVFEAYTKKEEECYLMELFLLDLRDNSVLPLFPETEICHGIDAMPTGRTACGSENPAFQMNVDGSFIYFISGWNGCENVYRLPVRGDRHIEKITDGKFSVHSFCVPREEKLVYTRGDLLTIAEFYCMDMGTKMEGRLTLSNSWLEHIQLSKPEEMWIDSKDGKAKIHGFVARPAGFDAHATELGAAPAENGAGLLCPAVLYIHGGPETYYAHDFWFEVQMLAAKGFAVVCCDPRGSSGYGSAFGSEKFAWGGEAVDDLTSFLDAAAALGYLDGNRVGVTGGSYGGYTTIKLIGSMGRFKAAVAQRNLCNMATSYGTGDMGFIWKEEGMQTQMQNLMGRVSRSLITKIDRMKTPLLILHATNDYRCSFEQAEQMFIAMKERNPEIPVRLVAFPGENHNMTRSGRVHFQIAHLREMTEWFERFLEVEEK